MELSKRLQAVAGLVTEGASVADIGTDHGYIPIYLIEHHIAEKVIAMDINRGPLERAQINIKMHKMTESIETRLSNGLEKLIPGEVDTIIASGMGGALVCDIIERGKRVVEQLEVMILQPQSELDKVRIYLNEHRLQIVEEDMVEEDGKFYPMMKVIHGEKENYEPCEYLYGKQLLKKKHPVMKKYLLRELEIKTNIMKKLVLQQGTSHIQGRIQELKQELELTKKALSYFEIEGEIHEM